MNSTIKKAIVLAILTVFGFVVSTNIIMYSVDIFINKQFEKFNILKALTYFKISAMYLKILGVQIGLILFSILIKSLNSGNKINKGQYGTNRFTTLSEIKTQYKEIPEKDDEYEGNGGILVSRYKDKIFIDDGARQSMCIGTTQSQKTQTVVYPTIDILSRAKNKPSMLITDSKGELATATINKLVKRGYEVDILNFINPELGSRINPLKIITDEWEKGNETNAISILENVSYKIFKSSIEKSNDPFWIEAAQSLFSSVVLRIIDKCIEDKEKWKISVYTAIKFVIEKTSNEYEINPETGEEILVDINNLGYELDKYFNKFHIDYQPRLLYSTFADTKGKTRAGVLAVFKSKLKLFLNKDVALMTSKNTIDLKSIGFNVKNNDCFKLKNTWINKILNKEIEFKLLDEDLNSLKEILNQETIDFQVSIDDLNLESLNSLTLNFKLESLNFKKNFKDEDYRNLVNYFLNYLKIEKEILVGDFLKRKSFDELIEQINIKKDDLIFSNEVNLNNIELCINKNKPKAIFLLIPDFDKSKNILATLFIEQLYFVLSKESFYSENKACDRDVFFLLEELGQLPQISDLDSMITMSLSKRIKFLLVFQSFTQVNSIYGKKARTIIENCANLIYILTTDLNTAKEISERCGNKTELSLSRSGHDLELDIEKRKNESAKAEKIILTQDLMQLKLNESIVLRSTKRTDLKGNKIIPYPIYNRGKTAFKPAYEYLANDFKENSNIMSFLQEKYKNNIYDLSQYKFEG